MRFTEYKNMRDGQTRRYSLYQRMRETGYSYGIHFSVSEECIEDGHLATMVRVRRKEIRQRIADIRAGVGTFAVTP